MISPFNRFEVHIFVRSARIEPFWRKAEEIVDG